MQERFETSFLTTRETFPGERSFAELCEGFFSAGSLGGRANFISEAWKHGGLLVHMANPEQLDDLFAHIDRESRVRFLPCSYIHEDIRPTVYAIGRGTGLILDHAKVSVDHVSVCDARTVRDHKKDLVAEAGEPVATLADLHRVLAAKPRDEWNEVNVSFNGASPVAGIFSLDGIMSKLYATVLHLRSGRRLPVFAYSRGENMLKHFEPDRAAVSSLIEQVPVPFLRDRYRHLLKVL